jgi:hypothetical protein
MEIESESMGRSSRVKSESRLHMLSARSNPDNPRQTSIGVSKRLMVTWALIKEGSYLGFPARHQGGAHSRSRAVRDHEEGAARENP